MRWIGYCLPLTWFVKIARGVMVRGAPIDALWLPLVVLALMATVVFTALGAALQARPGAGGDGEPDAASVEPGGRRRDARRRSGAPA